MLKAYKYRLYPSKKQQEYFAKCFGCARFIYNKMLNDKIEHYKLTGKMLKLKKEEFFMELKCVECAWYCRREERCVMTGEPLSKTTAMCESFIKNILRKK